MLTKFQLWVLRWILDVILQNPGQYSNSIVLFREYRAAYNRKYYEDNFYTRESFMKDAITHDLSFPEIPPKEYKQWT